MPISTVNIEGILIFTPRIFTDDRGIFMRVFGQTSMQILASSSHLYKRIRLIRPEALSEDCIIRQAKWHKPN